MKEMASLYLGLGLVGIGFGLLSIVLLAFGAPTGLAWIYGNFIAGAVLVALGLAGSLDTLRERLASAEARRIERYGTSAILQTVAGIAILGLLAFLAHRHPVRFDWSEAKIHSLTEQTKQVLANLEEDVHVTAFYQAVVAQPVRELLERYAYESPRFHFEFADPTARPDLVQEYGLSGEELEQGLLRVAMGEESVLVKTPDEESLTNALVKLSRTGEKVVYFVEGHNERRAVGEGSEAREGFGRAAEALSNENYRVETLLLATKGEVPEDADVVVLAGPTRPYLEEEHAALRRYLARGGALLAMVDPRAHTDVTEDLADLGAQIGDDVIVDQLQGLFGRAATPIAAEYADHPITEKLREPTMFHVARSVRAAEDSDLVEIVKTSADSWAERNLEEFFGRGRAEFGDGDLPGPVPVAVAGEVEVEAEPAEGASGDAAGEGEAASGGPARVVIFGDSDFASNQILDSFQNRDLFVNAVNWLMGDVEAITVRPNKSRPSRLSQLTASDFSRIRYLSLFVLPEGIAVLGVLAWWSRRRAPGR